MSRRRLIGILLVLIVLGGSIALAWSLVASWRDSLRMPLIAASVAGILFIIIAPSMVRRGDAPR